MERILFAGGNIITFDSNQPRASFLLVEGDKIAASGKQASNYNLEFDKKVDLKGRTVLPGFNDSHLHLRYIGESLEVIDLKNVKSRQELQEKVRNYIKENNIAAGEWVKGRGWNQDKFQSKKLPDRHLLDQAAPDNPVILKRSCGHIAVANKIALDIAGIDKNTTAGEGGKIDRKKNSRQPTGILREKAIGLVDSCLPKTDKVKFKKLLDKGMKELAKKGLTSVQTDDFGSFRDFENGYQAYLELKRNKELSLRINLQLRLGGDKALKKMLEDYKLRTGTGDKWLRVGPCKILGDGSLGGRTAALSQPYSDKPGTRGQLLYSPDKLERYIKTAHKNGFQLAVHAIGDRTIELLVDLYRKIIYDDPDFEKNHGELWGKAVNYRPRLIHGQITTLDLIERITNLGIAVDIQPIFLNSDLHIAETRLGPSRLKGAYAWKTMLDRGVFLGGGSDGPVDDYNPLAGIYSAVTRKDLQGRPESGWRPEESLSVEEAVSIFTEGSSYNTFEEKIKGNLAVGKLADFVVLNNNPFTCDPEAIKDIEVISTYVGGNPVYQK